MLALTRIADKCSRSSTALQLLLVACARESRESLLPKDTVGCLTNVSLGEFFHWRYHQHSCFPSLMAHVETR